MCVCVSVSEIDSLCVYLWQRDCWQRWFTTPLGLASVTFFLWPSPPLAVTFSKKKKRPDSRAGVVCACLAVCWSVFAYLLLCRYQSVGASWGDRGRHYLGNVHDHQPGGQQVRDSHWGVAVCFQGCSLLIFHPVTQHFSSLFLLSLPNMHTHTHTHPHVLYTHTHTVQMRAYSRPAWDPCSFCRHYRGGHMCHKYIGSCRQIALLP